MDYNKIISELNSIISDLNKAKGLVGSKDDTVIKRDAAHLLIMQSTKIINLSGKMK